MEIRDKNKEDYLKAAAEFVYEAMAEYPDIEIPVEQELADYMGLCVDKSLDDEEDYYQGMSQRLCKL